VRKDLGTVIGVCALAAIAIAEPTKHYPASWWTPIPQAGAPDWEILPQSAKPGEVILSKRNELGMLSNFAATPFNLRGQRYASVEGFWQMMLYPESPSDPRAADKTVVWRYTRDQVAQMSSFQAKEAGTLAEQNMQKLGIDWVTFEGRRMPYRSMEKGEHYQLIREAMLAKLDQNPRVREILLSTGDLVLRPDHIQEVNAPPEWAYFQIWMEIRNDLKQQIIDPALASVQLFDQPNYVVAGVTESAYLGGYGSDAGARSVEALTKATVALKGNASPENSSPIVQTEASIGAALTGDPNNARLHHALAVLEEHSGKPIDALHEFQRAAELQPTEGNLFDWAAELLLHDAPQAASEVFDKGVRQFPDSSRMLLGSAAAFYARADYPQAARRFFEATDLNPSDPEPYLVLADVQAPEITGSGAYVERLARFVRLLPGNAWANYLYATTLWDSKSGSARPESLARAQSALEMAVRLDPTLASAWLQLGMLYSEKQDFHRAIEAYARAISADPALEQAHYRLAAIYRKLGDTQNAQQETIIFDRLTRSSTRTHEEERSRLQRFVVDLKSSGSTH